MKFYNSMGPNPKVVRMFAAEKGMELPLEEVDLMAGDNRKEPYISKNPAGQMPCLETDSGEFIAEVTAICEYLDEVGSGPSLIGDTAEERGATRMWTRRVDLNICENLANGFRYAEGLPIFEKRITVLPEAAEGLKRITREKLEWLDGLVGAGPFLCGERFSLADVLLFCFLEFGGQVGQPLDAGLTNLNAWYERVSGRASASA